jgi:hypothetical protein
MVIFFGEKFFSLVKLMNKPLFLWLFTLYLAAAAAFGALRIGELWSGWSVWCLLLPPLVFWAVQALDWWRRGGPVQVLVGVGLVAFVLLCLSGLGIAWVLAVWMENTRLFQQLSPTVRALIGAAIGLAVGGMARRYKLSREAVEPPQAG